MCVIGLVGDDGVRCSVFEQDVRPLQIVRLSRREMEPRRIAQSIHRGVNLGAQPSTASSDRL